MLLAFAESDGFDSFIPGAYHACISSRLCIWHVAPPPSPAGERARCAWCIMLHGAPSYVIPPPCPCPRIYVSGHRGLLHPTILFHSVVHHRAEVPGAGEPGHGHGGTGPCVCVPLQAMCVSASSCLFDASAVVFTVFYEVWEAPRGMHREARHSAYGGSAQCLWRVGTVPMEGRPHAPCPPDDEVPMPHACLRGTRGCGDKQAHHVPGLGSAGGCGVPGPGVRAQGHGGTGARGCC